MNSFKINSKTYAMDALRQLNAVNSKVAMHQARLSTGKRINNAQDDAAAYAVIQKSYNTIKSNQVIKDGVRNGKNLLTMIEASMTTQMELWQRIKELDMQKSSGTLTDNQKAMIDERINTLIAELDDIANSTKWNGESLINGTKSSIDIMVGEGEMMTIALPNTTSSGLGILTNSNTKSLSFDGNDYVSLPEIDTLLGEPGSSFTVQISAKHNNSDNNGVLIHSTEGSHSTIFGRVEILNNKFSYYHRTSNENDESRGNIELEADTWNNVFLVVDSASGKVQNYVNGVLDESSVNDYDTSNDYSSSGRVWELGGISNNANYTFFNGQMDEVAIWNKALSQSEISSLYNDGIIRDVRYNSGDYSSKDNLKAYYKMEGSGNTLTDSSGNNKDGTINGATRDSDNPGGLTRNISNTTTNSLLSHLQTIGSKIQRLESKEEALMDQTTAQEAVRSSIEDADFAEEQMELIKTSIMQQTAIAALSQANSAPQIVLSLFQS